MEPIRLLKRGYSYSSHLSMCSLCSRSATADMRSEESPEQYSSSIALHARKSRRYSGSVSSMASRSSSIEARYNACICLQDRVRHAASTIRTSKRHLLWPLQGANICAVPRTDTSREASSSSITSCHCEFSSQICTSSFRALDSTVDWSNAHCPTAAFLDL